MLSGIYKISIYRNAVFDLVATRGAGLVPRCCENGPFILENVDNGIFHPEMSDLAALFITATTNVFSTKN